MNLIAKKGCPDGCPETPRGPASRRNPLIYLERETGFEPATLSLGRRRTPPAPGRTRPQGPATTALGDKPDPHRPQQAAASSPKFRATLGATVQAVLRARFGQVELTVGAVAERLRVSTATVYSLCRRGELEHHRISVSPRRAPC